MRVIDYLFESAHPGGTYAAFIPTVEGREELYAYCASLGIDNLVDPDEYHCTLIYSKKSCPDIERENFNLPCSGLPIGFEVLGTDTKVLVLKIYCPNARGLHSLFVEKYGATHDFDDYIPHITVADDFSGEIPSVIPDFEIIFSDKTVEELN